MIKAIIFDCFGVLVTEGWLDFKAEHFGHDQALLKRASQISNQADSGLISRSEANRLTSELAGITPEEFSKTVFTNQPNGPLFDYIHELKKHYKIGMLSNVSGNWLYDMFTPEQIKLFDAVNLSFESGYVKPDERAYTAMVERLGVAPGECIFIDDSEGHLQGARKVGMQGILYKDFEQARADIEKLLTDSKS